jgi:solute:Na+ symporter, SSS family
MNFSRLDWTVLVFTLLLIIVYGVYRSRTSKNLEGYLLSDRQMPWWIVLLSIMGTQASAITFLTVPGQAYSDGMRFVQYYFGLPLAMVVVCIMFVPVFHRLKVFTAYEYLEQRFDIKTRLLTSFLFLLSRGLSTGVSILAPSIVLHSMLGWDVASTSMFMGGLLIIYTVSGGAKAVAYTQQLQLIIIYAAMFLAAWWAIKKLPEGIGFTDALHIGGKSGKLNVITSGFTDKGFDWKDRYNIWSGVIGGFFLALSYFGTDQSQVGRYLTARSEQESKLGLLMNGLVKVPLQFGILLIGVLLFAFYQFKQAPAFFNLAQEQTLRQSANANEFATAEQKYKQVQDEKRKTVVALGNALHQQNETQVDELRTRLQQQQQQAQQVRDSISNIVKKTIPGSDGNDTNYVFLRFVGDFLPKGLVGLIIAIIFLASWSSIAAALHALASCTMIDFHKRFAKRAATPLQEYRWSQAYVLIWGVFSVIVALYSKNLGNSLVEAVNILGSWFYGTILGIFLVALYLKRVGGHAVFIGAIIAEIIVISVYYLNFLSFLWLNLIGALAVVIFSFIIQVIFCRRAKTSKPESEPSLQGTQV